LVLENIKDTKSDFLWTNKQSSEKSRKEKQFYLEKILELFNDSQNKQREYIHAFIGNCTSGKEVNLINVSNVHIMEPLYSQSLKEQAIGHALRFCSHCDSNVDNRVVSVYTYISTVEAMTNHKTSGKKSKNENIIPLLHISADQFINFKLTEVTAVNLFLNFLRKVSIVFY
jgi:hypothetical protein